MFLKVCQSRQAPYYRFNSPRYTMNSVHAIQSIYEKVTPGADEQEHTTPIVSLCHGIFAE